MRSNLLYSLLSGALVLTALVTNAETAASDPALVFKTYSLTGLATARGLAAAGKYVWITSMGPRSDDDRVIRLNASNGDTKVVESEFGRFLSQVVASRRSAWVVDGEPGSVASWSLLRINAATLSVQRIKIPGAVAIGGVGINQTPIFLAGGYVWIPGTEGILRVDTTTLQVSTITSPLINGSPFTAAVDAHYLWMTAPMFARTNATFFVRVSLATGAVRKVSFPGVKGGMPIGDDGTNLWIQNASGVHRIDPATDQVTTVAVPKSALITLPYNGSSAAADGAIYFCAELSPLQRSGVVRADFSSRAATVVNSPLLYQPEMVVSANGVLWVLNWPRQSTAKNRAILVRVK